MVEHSQTINDFGTESPRFGSFDGDDPVAFVLTV